MIQALIFDFDGLILDTEITAYRSWLEIYQEYQCEFPLEKWVECIGGGSDLFDACAYLESLVGQPLEREGVIARRLRRHLEMAEVLEALPGVEEYITQARKMHLKVGLASSSSRAWVVKHLTRLGLLDHFDILHCGDEVSHKKPNPELYLGILGKLSVHAEQAIALEDSANGLRAAQQAGIFCVVVPNIVTRRLLLDAADLRLTSLVDMPLPALIAEVERRKSKRQEYAGQHHD
jgi:HAD superfamily hydrolase (TIGR01509 family)